MELFLLSIINSILRHLDKYIFCDRRCYQHSIKTSLHGKAVKMLHLQIEENNTHNERLDCIPIGLQWRNKIDYIFSTFCIFRPTWWNVSFCFEYEFQEKFDNRRYPLISHLIIHPGSKGVHKQTYVKIRMKKSELV